MLHKEDRFFIINRIGEHNMEDKIKELTKGLSVLQIRNERIKEEYANNKEKIKLITEELNELLEDTKDNKKN